MLCQILMVLDGSNSYGAFSDNPQHFLLLDSSGWTLAEPCMLEQEELPERLLGTCRLEHLDLSAAAHLDLSSGHITRKDET